MSSDIQTLTPVQVEQPPDSIPRVRIPVSAKEHTYGSAAVRGRGDHVVPLLDSLTMGDMPGQFIHALEEAEDAPGPYHKSRPEVSSSLLHSAQTHIHKLQILALADAEETWRQMGYTEKMFAGDLNASEIREFYRRRNQQLLDEKKAPKRLRKPLRG